MTDQELFSVVGILPDETSAVSAPRRRDLPYTSLALLGLIVLCCLCAPLLTKHDPAYMDLLHCAEAPSAAFWFGTDTMGRDIFACIWYGGRVSLAVGFLAAAISTVIAVVYGAVSGMGEYTFSPNSVVSRAQVATFLYRALNETEKPVDPVEPVDPDPVDPVEPTEPVDPEPTEPVEPAEPPAEAA